MQSDCKVVAFIMRKNKEDKNIVEKIPSERILTVSHATNNFIKSLANRRKPLDSIKADMKLKGLRGKEYIHCIGLWDRYIKYLEKNL